MILDIWNSYICKFIIALDKRFPERLSVSSVALSENQSGNFLISMTSSVKRPIKQEKQ